MGRQIQFGLLFQFPILEAPRTEDSVIGHRDKVPASPVHPRLMYRHPMLQRRQRGQRKCPHFHQGD